MDKFKPNELGIDNFYKDEEYVFIDLEPIKKFMYLISNYGNIYSLKSKKIIKYDITEKGYAKVTLQINDDKKYQKSYKVHRLVAYFFCENKNPDIFTEPDHLDLNRLNNYYKNLEWISHAENIRRAREKGNMTDKSTESYIRSICQMFQDEMTIFEVYTHFHPEEIGKHCKLNDKKFYKFLYLILMNKRHSFIRSQYNIAINKVKSPYFTKNIYSEENIIGKIKEGKSNMEIMNDFGFKTKNENTSLYKRILIIRKKFND